MKTVHIGFAHRADDVRIYTKECMSLEEAGYEVVYITAATDKPVFKSGSNVTVKQLDIKRVGYSRLKHPIRHYKNNAAVHNAIYDAAYAEKADVYHVHEYSLLGVALKLKKELKAKVIYDAHECVPEQILNQAFGKSAPARAIKKANSLITELTENRNAKKCDAVVAATEHIAERFTGLGIKTEVVRNYPQVSDEAPVRNPVPNTICYVGTVFKARGITQLVQAVEGTDVILRIAGNIPTEYEKELSQLGGWKNVKKEGFLSGEKVALLMSECCIGMVTLLPTPNIFNSLPVKLFEYMRAGMPVIASDFPLWAEIVNGAHCGICVQPESVESIKGAISELLSNSEEAKRMGSNGRTAAVQKYNWTTEKQRLIAIYSELVG